MRNLSNGQVVTELGSKAYPEFDSISVDGIPIKIPQRVIYIFNKPRSVVCTMEDPFERRSVKDYVKDLPVRVFPVGRLDYDVSGLLLLTNDGDYANELLHPRYAVERVYWARVKGEPTEKTLHQLQRGVLLEDGLAKAKRVRPLQANLSTTHLLGEIKAGESLLELIATEGRKHFVKRILETVGHPVEALSRVQFGPYALGNLQPGRIKQVALREEICG